MFANMLDQHVGQHVARFAAALTLQACSPVFPVSAKADSKEYVSFECSDKVGRLPEKSL